jgi:hypothetical protein
MFWYFKKQYTIILLGDVVVGHINSDMGGDVVVGHLNSDMGGDVVVGHEPIHFIASLECSGILKNNIQ